MGDKENDVLRNFYDACIQCGECLDVCSWLDNLKLTPGEISEEVLDGQISDELVQAIQRCSLCGLCSQICPVDLSTAEMIQESRAVLMRQGKIQVTDYDVMQVDLDWHYFTLYRSTYGIEFDYLQQDQYNTLFFPGCTLSSYAPELTREIHKWLVEQRGEPIGFTDTCCGKPLASIGLEERAIQLLERLQTQMQKAGATRLITACPNCHHMLDKYLKDVELISLYDLLANAGIQIQGVERLSVHDSCPDRFGVTIGTQVRNLLSSHSLVEMEHYGAETLCCGSGGIVSSIDPELSRERAIERMAEFSATGAERCITACMSCAYRLSRASSEGRVAHCLELVFDSPVDYPQIAANVRAMWEGEWGEYNLYRLSEAKLVTGENDNA